MDRTRAAARQAAAMQNLAERMSSIEARLAPRMVATELIESEPLASAAQIAALAEQVTDLKQGIISLMGTTADRFTRIDEKLDALADGPVAVRVSSAQIEELDRRINDLAILCGTLTQMVERLLAAPPAPAHPRHQR